jgi:hypothetical protein
MSPYSLIDRDFARAAPWFHQYRHNSGNHARDPSAKSIFACGFKIFNTTNCFLSFINALTYALITQDTNRYVLHETQSRAIHTLYTANTATKQYQFHDRDS